MGTEPLEKVVGRLLTEQKLTIALAESCTGGLIAHRLTNVPGSSAYLIGGVVSYANEAKERILGVSHQTLQEHGAVSEETAQAMALGARAVSGADLAVSVTGIAGPTGGSEDKPVGTVCFALATSEGVDTFRLRFAGVRWQVQAKACCWGLDLVRRYLLGVSFNS